MISISFLFFDIHDSNYSYNYVTTPIFTD
jgi:hypothetical protein